MLGRACCARARALCATALPRLGRLHRCHMCSARSCSRLCLLAPVHPGLWLCLEDWLFPRGTVSWPPQTSPQQQRRARSLREPRTRGETGRLETGTPASHSPCRFCSRPASVARPSAIRLARASNHAHRRGACCAHLLRAAGALVCVRRFCPLCSRHHRCHNSTLARRPRHSRRACKCSGQHSRTPGRASQGAGSMDCSTCAAASPAPGAARAPAAVVCGRHCGCSAAATRYQRAPTRCGVDGRQAGSAAATAAAAGEQAGVGSNCSKGYSWQG